MAEAAIAPYLDPTLAQRAEEARDAWILEAQAALQGAEDLAWLDVLSNAQRLEAEQFNRLLLRASSGPSCGSTRSTGRCPRSWAASNCPSPAPEPDGETSETAKPLVDSEWGFRRMVEAMQARKALRRGLVLQPLRRSGSTGTAFRRVATRGVSPWSTRSARTLEFYRSSVWRKGSAQDRRICGRGVRFPVRCSTS